MKLKTHLFGLLLIASSISNSQCLASTISNNIPVGVSFNSKPANRALFKPNKPAESTKISNFAVAGFLVALAGLLLIFFVGTSISAFFLGSILSLAALIFSIIGLKATMKGKLGKGFAIAGIVISSIAILLSAFLNLLLLLFV